MAGFEIEGERFEIPAFDTFTLAECEILYEMTRAHGEPIVQEMFESADPDWPEERRREHIRRNLARVQRPDFKTALASIAYLRRHPETTLEAARALGGSANGLAVTVAIILGGDEEDPTRRSSNDSPTQRDSESSSSEPEKTEDSGKPSESYSTEPAIPPATIGTIDSDTSSRGAPPIASVS